MNKGELWLCNVKSMNDTKEMLHYMECQLVTLIDEGYTSGSQLVAMQNYMLQRGHTEQADLFYGADQPSRRL